MIWYLQNVNMMFYLVCLGKWWMVESYEFCYFSVFILTSCFSWISMNENIQHLTGRVCIFFIGTMWKDRYLIQETQTIAFVALCQVEPFLLHYIPAIPSYSPRNKLKRPLIHIYLFSSHLPPHLHLDLFLKLKQKSN